MKTYQKGDKYTTTVEVKKTKKGQPTVIYLDGRKYAFIPDGKER